jgi:hypothetical protein
MVFTKSEYNNLNTKENLFGSSEEASHVGGLYSWIIHGIPYINICIIIGTIRLAPCKDTPEFRVSSGSLTEIPSQRVNAIFMATFSCRQL